MPVTMASLAQRNDRATNGGCQPSLANSARLIAVAANPSGQMKVSQVSPMRRLNDFQRKYRKGRITPLDSRIAKGSSVRKRSRALNATQGRRTDRKTKPTRRKCMPKDSRNVRIG